MLLKKILVTVIIVMAACQFSSAQISTKDKLNAALTAIQKNYVDSLSDQTLTDAAIKGMFTSLDPHSKYFSAKEAQEMKTMMSGSFVGIGIQYITQNDSVFITQIIPGGPAEKGGVMPGDRILKIDSVVVTGARLSNMDILKKIRGTNKSPIRLELYRQALKK